MRKFILFALALSLVSATCLAQNDNKANEAQKVGSEPSSTDRSGNKNLNGVSRELVRQTIFGTLPNGLHYTIIHNDNPQRAIVLRLIMTVGAYNENQDEIGAAHFIEHLAVMDNVSFPNEKPDRYFSPMGVGFGRDLNAHTGLNETSYELDLPETAALHFDRALDWLRGVADGTRFLPEEVNVERGIIRAELEARHSPQTDTSYKAAHFQAPTLRSFNREVGGTPESLAALNYTKLHEFYSRWYRPQNAYLVIVGDKAASIIEASIRDKFSSWHGALDNNIAPAVAEKLPDRGIDSVVFTGNYLTTAVSACRIGPPDPNNLPETTRVRNKYMTAIWTNIINARFQQALVQPQSKLLGALATVNLSLTDAKATCISAVPLDEAWQAAISKVQSEFQRFVLDGPTPIEVDRETDKLRGFIRTEIGAYPTESSNALAADVLQSIRDNVTYLEPRQKMRAFDLAVEGVTPAKLRERFEQDWHGSGPLLIAAGPHPPTKETLLKSWIAGANAPTAVQYIDAVTKPWPYTNFGKAGKIVTRVEFMNPDFTRLTFSNGSILNFKHSDLEKNNISIVLDFGWGRREILPSLFIQTVLATAVFEEGGLNKITAYDLRHSALSYAAGFTFEPLSDRFKISASVEPGSIIQKMQILAAYMSDPAFDNSIDARVPTIIDLIYRRIKTSPTASASDSLDRALFPGGPLILPNLATLRAYKASDFGRILKPIITTSPIEITIVGDIDEQTAVDAVVRSIGALPNRDRTEPSTPDRAFNIFSSELPPPMTVYHDGPKDQAAINIIWPLYVASPERRKEEYSISLLAGVFNDRLLAKLRLEMGKTYSPTVRVTAVDHADQGYIGVQIESLPADLDALLLATRSVARELVMGQIEQRELDAVLAPKLSSFETRKRKNGYWINTLAGSARTPELIEETQKYRAIMMSVTLDDVKRAAKTWLARTPAISKAFPRNDVSK